LRALLLFLALGLAGCASPGLRPPPADRPVAAALSRFALEGRLQVRDGERSAAVGLDWQHEAGRDDWLFTGPLGQGLARMEADADGARLRFADGRRLQAASAAELAESLLGVAAPFADLTRWVTARPGPGAAVREADGQGRLLRIVDQGWTIEYIEYMDEAPDALPRKLDIHRGEARLRLIVDGWTQP